MAWILERFGKKKVVTEKTEDGPAVCRFPANYTEFQFELLEKYLLQKPVEELRTHAVNAERIARPGIMGGIHDFVNTLEKEQIISFILKLAVENKKLLSLDFYNVEETTEMIYLSEDPVFETHGGLHDYIYRTERDTLMVWALTAEKYEKRRY
jgi:hypothetical protein